MPKDPCSELSKTITQLAMNIGSRPEVQNLDHVVTELQKHIPEITRETLVASINEATSGGARAKSELQSKLTTLKGEARKDVRLRAAIGDMQRHLAGGTLPERAARVLRISDPSPSIEALAQKKEALTAALRQSEPAIRKKFEAQITNLTDRLENGVAGQSIAKADRPLSGDLARLEFERDKLQKEVKRNIEAGKPRSILNKTVGALNDVTHFALGGDLGLILRQGGPLSMAYPEHVPAAIADTVRALSSERGAYESQKQIDGRFNAPLYAKSKLAFTAVDGPLRQSEEGIVGRLVGNLPGFKQLARGQIAYLNRLRADAFDTMAASFGHDGAVTLDEATSIAKMINQFTGRADMGKYENGVQLANAVFLAPKLFVSRFQMIAGQSAWGAPSSARVAIAKAYGRFLTGISAIYALGLVSGGTVSTNPRSKDFGKIRIGDTTIDPTAGLAAATTLISRNAAQAIENTTGHKFDDVDGLNTRQLAEGSIGRFLSYKLTPAIQLTRQLATGKDAIGKDITPLEALGGNSIPLTFRDLRDAMKEEGVPTGIAMGVLSFFGAGISSYPRKADETAASHGWSIKDEADNIIKGARAVDVKDRQAYIEKRLKNVAPDDQGYVMRQLKMRKVMADRE